MFRLICVLILIIWIRQVFGKEEEEAAAESLDIEPNIVRYGDAPYIVLVYVYVTKLRCTGTVISSSFILTAAHCYVKTEPAKRDSVVLYGQSTYTENELQLIHKLRRIPVIEVNIHPDYFVGESGTSKHADIAILELVTSITDDADLLVQILTLGGAWPTDESLSLIPMSCVVLGFGHHEETNDTMIYRTEVVALRTRDDCKCVQKNIICSKQPPTVLCKGQSAYPLICRRQVFGIASYNILNRRCTSPKDLITYEKNLFCEEASGSVITSICPFLSWINDVVDDPTITTVPPSCKAHSHQNHSCIYIFTVFIITKFIFFSKNHF